MPFDVVYSIDVDSKSNFEVINKAIQRKWNKALRLSKFPILQRLEKELLFGGSNIRGFTNTTTGRWILSPEGLGQIGLTSPQQIDQLYDGIQRGIRVASEKGALVLKIFDLITVARLTPHPDPTVKIRSWFVDWIVNQEPVDNRGFVKLGVFLAQQHKRGRAGTLPRSYQIAGPGGAGFMFPRGFSGSQGFWRVPPGVGGEDVFNWLDKNIPGIEILVQQEIKKNIGTI